MKTRNIILIFILFVFAAAITLNAQEDIDKEAVSSKIDKIFQLAKNKQYKDLSLLVVYSGNNQKRYYKSSLNPDTDNELQQAERIAKKIKAYLDISDNYKVGNPSFKSQNNYNWADVTVEFISGKQNLDITFKFIKVNGDLLLADID